MRKERDIWMYYEKQQLFVKLNGKNLRYLGPDERSIFMLLLKIPVEKSALYIAPAFPIESPWHESTPGIHYIKNISLTTAIEIFKKERSAFGLYNLTIQQQQHQYVDYTELATIAGEKSELCFFFNAHNPDVPETIMNVCNIHTIKVGARNQCNTIPARIMLLNLYEDHMHAMRP